ncbi:hypothetical protein CP532_2834 [Ophiocordyceps camponoti-leonardi (nom. inval.)]|nr:hypothetical protein CP532_2834 [Ophiocordyceps camponoti-leonardi (nom. inval.)]
MLRQTLSASLRAASRSTPLRVASFRKTPISLPPLARQVQLAWYSEAKETSEKEAPVKEQNPAASATESSSSSGAEGTSSSSSAGQDQETSADPVSELKKALESKDKETREWKDKCLRSVADFRNLQERTKREVKTARDFAITKFAKDLVDSVDNLDRALTTVPPEKLSAEEKSEDLQDLANLYEGLKMTQTILLQTLVKHGLEQLNPEGDVFNPNEHEAIFMAPMPDKENNTVCHVQQKGFKLNGRVLRAAKVGVVKNNAESSSSSSSSSS